jgi:hypothetical protein
MDLLDRLWQRADLTEQQAGDLAAEALGAARAARDAHRARG